MEVSGAYVGLSGYTLWDRDTMNAIGYYPTLEALVQAAFALGQTNPDRSKFPATDLAVVDEATV
jgi:hypothetical protein